MPDTMAGLGGELVHELEFTDWAGNVTVSDGMPVALIDCNSISFCTQTKVTSVPACTATLSVQDCFLASGVWSSTNIPRHSSLGVGVVVGIYIYTNGVGTGQSAFNAAVPFGTLCLNGFARSPAATLIGAQGGICNTGTMDLPVNATTTPPVQVGQDVNVQLWYRDPTPALPGNANFSNAVFYTVL
jgi:hypothetical protein